MTGPNGSGKTTLLSLILVIIHKCTQMISRYSGYIGDRVQISGASKRIGWMAPGFGVYPLETCGQNVVLSGYYDSIGLFCKPSKQKRCKVEDLFDAFGISELKKVSLGSMSEGNQRLLLLLRAIVRPELLILDEPCQGLPPDSRQQVISIVDTLAYQCSTPSSLWLISPDDFLHASTENWPLVDTGFRLLVFW